MSKARPNLLFIFPDEMRQQAMGFMNADPVITPNLDSLSTESAVLPNAVSNYPVCSPYRAMLLTGKYPFSNGVPANCNSWANRYEVYLRDDEVCFSDVLSQGGYDTGYIGKWHLDPPDAPHADCWQESVWDAYNSPGPRRHSFDMWHAYGCYNRHLAPYYYIGDAKEGDKTFFDQWSVEHETDVAIEYIRNANGKQRDPDKPFALFMSMNPPHMPFDQVPERYVQMYGDQTSEDLLTRPNVKLEGAGDQARQHARNYFAAVTGIDENVGRLTACLKEEGLEDDTIVVFTSDHGEMMGSHGLMHKVLWYDESFLVPFIIRWPGRIASGVNDLHLGVPDLMPSLLGLMRLEHMTPQGVEGHDYSSVLLGESDDKPSSAFYVWPNLQDNRRDARGVRTVRHTFVVDRRERGERAILFDNTTDPYQMTNIAQDRPNVVRELTDELRDWLERTSDPWSGTV